MKKSTLALGWLLVLGCTGQTGEEDPAAMCHEDITLVPVGDTTPLGIVPLDYFSALQDAGASYEVAWGADGTVSEALEVRFVELTEQASYVVASAEGPSTTELACPDFLLLDVTLAVETGETDVFAETVAGKALIYENGDGHLDAMLPRDQIQGSFGANGQTPSGLTFERLELHLMLERGEVTGLRLTAESDQANRTGEVVAAWP